MVEVVEDDGNTRAEVGTVCALSTNEFPATALTCLTGRSFRTQRAGLSVFFHQHRPFLAFLRRHFDFRFQSDLAHLDHHFERPFGAGGVGELYAANHVAFVLLRNEAGGERLDARDASRDDRGVTDQHQKAESAASNSRLSHTRVRARRTRG